MSDGLYGRQAAFYALAAGLEESLHQRALSPFVPNYRPIRKEPTMGSILDDFYFPLARPAVRQAYTGPTFPETAKPGARVKLKHKRGELHAEFIVGEVRTTQGKITAIVPQGFASAYYSAGDYSYELVKPARVPLPKEPGLYVFEADVERFRDQGVGYVYSLCNTRRTWSRRHGGDVTNSVSEVWLEARLAEGAKLVKLVPGRA